MKRGTLIRIITAVALLPLFVTCAFETDGKFAGLVAGYEKQQPQSLQPPTNVQAAGDSSGGIQISWDISANADGYTIYRAPADNPDHIVRRGSTGGTTYIDTGASVPPDIPYYYRLTAYKSGEVSEPSGWAGPVFAVQNQGILEAPEITGTDVSGNSITITWTPVTGAEGYILYRASMYDGDVYIIRHDTKTTVYNDENLAAGSYSYQVRGYNDSGEGYVSIPSDSVNIETGTGLPAPAKPQNLRAAVDYSGAEPVINVSWNTAANAGSYHVYRSADNEYYEEIGEASSTTYRDEGIISGEAYYYRVRGYNGTQEGYLSDSYGPVLTRPGKPEITAADVGNTVIVSWNDVYGADIYYVYRSPDGEQFQLLTARGTGNISYEDLGLAAGTYYYYVEAANSAGRGLSSDSAQAVLAVDAAAPVINEHPAGGAYFRNVPASRLMVHASVSDGGVLSYQWYSNAVNSNSDGTLISGAISSSYTPPTNTAGTIYYYVVVTNTKNGMNGNITATAVSNAAVVVVTEGGGTTVIEIPQGGTRININTQADLEAIRAHIDDPAYNNGKNAYVLEQDITLSGTWTPIGRVETVNQYGVPTDSIHAFSGNLYGNGHTIRNLVLPGGSIHFIGLFGYIEDALIQDLQVELGTNVISVTNSTSQRIGIIAGAHKNSVIRNCGIYSQSGITVSNSNNYSTSIGGISGINMEGDISSIIENCYASMNITTTSSGTHNDVGGIANFTNTIRNCYYIGNITGNGLYSALHGVDSGEVTIIQMSYSAGTITNNATSSGWTSSSGIGRVGSLSSCVTLMERINNPNSTYYARIQYDHHNKATTLANNYAYAGMLVRGSTVTSNDPNSRNGLDKTAAQLKQRSTYETGLGWDFNNVWEMGPSSYPFPILKWQNGVVKLPPGFNVIGSGETLTASTATEFNSALSTIRSSSNDDFIIAITADFSLSPQDLTPAAYRNKRITLKGNTASRNISLSGQGSLFTVGADVELALEDIVLRGISNNNTSLVKVNTNGKLVMNSGGKVTGNTYSTSVNETGGAGVYVNNGTLEIAGGEISGNTVNGTIRGDVRGGGVYALNGSNVLMTGGAIRDNLVTNVASGEIIGANGGGIRIDNNSRFEMTGGIIEGNTLNSRSTNLMAAASGGGVVIVKNSSFYFRGGTIRKNTVNASGNNYCAAEGGGINITEGSDFIMNGGIISGNSVISSVNPNYTYGSANYSVGAYGGGVRFAFMPVSFVKTGGIIYGSEVSGNDADGIPLKNTAQSNSSGLGGGHAIYYDSGNGNSNPRRNTTVWETDNLYSNGSTLVDGTGPVVVPGTVGVTVAMWDKYGDGWDGNAALRINVNGTDLSTNARLGSGGGPGYHTFTVNPGDVVRFYWVNGGTYDYECSFAVYYTAASPNPAFNPSSGTTDSSRVLISKQYGSSGSVGNGTLMGSFTVP